MKVEDVIEKIPEGEYKAIRKQDLISVLKIKNKVSERTIENKINKAREKWFVHRKNLSDEEIEKKDLQRNEVLLYIDKNIENEKLKEKHTDELRDVIKELRESLPEIKKGVIQKPATTDPEQVINIERSHLSVKLADLPDEFTKITRASELETGEEVEAFYPTKSGVAMGSDSEGTSYLGQSLEVEENQLFDDLKENHIPEIIEKYIRFKENCYNLIKEKLDEDIKDYEREFIFELASKPLAGFKNPNLKDDAESVKEISSETTKKDNIPEEGILDLLQELKEDLKQAENFVFYENCPVIEKKTE